MKQLFITLWLLLAFVPEASAQRNDGFASNEAGQASSKAASEPAGTESAPLVIRMIESKDEQARREAREKDADEREAKSLQTQVRAATANEHQVTAGWAGVFLSLLGAIGLFLTIWYARRTAHEAARATNAATESTAIAQRSLEVAQNTASQQIRAYVHLEGAELHSPEKYEKDYEKRPFNHEIVLVLPIKNAGQTPAHALSVSVQFATFPGDSGMPETFEYSEYQRHFRLGLRTPSSAAPLGAGTTATQRVPLNDVEYDGVIEASKYAVRMYVYGTIRYRDIFNIDRCTRYCLELNVAGVEDKVAPLIPIGPHNDAT